MEKIINYENLRSFGYSNDKICKKPIKGIVISFFGLGDQTMFWEDEDLFRQFAEKGILYVIPYTNPWAWMNEAAVSFTDEIIDVLCEKYGLPRDIPIASTGGSMGGQSALVYSAYTKRPPVTCVVNCPVCDTVFHFTERPDLPRTLYSALRNSEGTLEEGLKSISPLHLTKKLPKCKYHFFHCLNDGAVNINSHSDKQVAAMKAEGFDVTYDVIPVGNHCDLGEDGWTKYTNYIIEEIFTHNK